MVKVAALLSKEVARYLHDVLARNISPVFRGANVIKAEIKKWNFLHLSNLNFLLSSIYYLQSIVIAYQLYSIALLLRTARNNDVFQPISGSSLERNVCRRSSVSIQGTRYDAAGLAIHILIRSSRLLCMNVVLNIFDQLILLPNELPLQRIVFHPSG